MHKLCGLWQGTDKNKNTYLSGNFLGIKILIFRNLDREANTNQSEWNLFLDQVKERGQPSAKEPQNALEKNKPLVDTYQPTFTKPGKTVYPDDDIPF